MGEPLLGLWEDLAGRYSLERELGRVDPTFDPLRKLPRFQKLVEGTT